MHRLSGHASDVAARSLQEMKDRRHEIALLAAVTVLGFSDAHWEQVGNLNCFDAKKSGAEAGGAGTVQEALAAAGADTKDCTLPALAAVVLPDGLAAVLGISLRYL